MQRRRGTNRANLYFFTCLTNNRVGVDRYTGMYVREEDIFSAIYYQLKGYIKSRSGFSVEYGSKKEKLEQKITECQAILSDSLEWGMRIYEQFVKNELDKDTYLAEKAKSNEAKKCLERVQHQLKMHARRYQQFLRSQQALNKEIPLD